VNETNLKPIIITVVVGLMLGSLILFWDKPIHLMIIMVNYRILLRVNMMTIWKQGLKVGRYLQRTTLVWKLLFLRKV